MENKVHYVEKDIEKILIDEETIQKRVHELAKQISQDYKGKDIIAVCILRGSTLFFADLMKYIEIPVAFEFMSVSSYGSGAVSSGKVNIKYDIQQDIKGKDILIVEDIIDSGITLDRLKSVLEERQPASFNICCLLNKPDRRVKNIDVKYVGFDIPDEFVVGYGLDYNEKYRNYGSVGILKREIYE